MDSIAFPSTIQASAASTPYIVPLAMAPWIPARVTSWLQLPVTNAYIIADLPQTGLAYKWEVKGAAITVDDDSILMIPRLPDRMMAILRKAGLRG